MQIKTMRYCLTLISVFIIKKPTNSKSWRECGETGALLHCWWECKLVQLLWKTVWRFLKKLKMELPYNQAVPFLGIYLDKTLNSERYMLPCVHSSTVYQAKTCNKPKCYQQMTE